MTLRKLIVAGGMVASAVVMAATAQARPPHHPSHGHWHHPVHHRHWHHR